MKLNSRKLHLPYLDGLRGFAALYVVFSHVLPHQGQHLPALIANPMQLFKYGSFSVIVFIVLSGYCLMLPVTRSQTGYISGSLFDYFKRRARRILPPYYAVIFLCLLLTLGILGLEKFTNFRWQEVDFDWFSPNFSFVDVILHLLLIHNFTPGKQVYTINLPMWSVAVEWQIYFLFVLLLLPIWRRWGLLSVITIAFFIGLIPHYLFNGFMNLSRPWLLGSFTLGMAAAEIGFSDKPHLMRLRKSVPWGLLAMIFTGVALITESKQLGFDIWIWEFFATIAAACFLVYCSNFFIEGKPLPKLLQVLESKAAILLGAFSYSLYLTHGPIVTLVNKFLESLQLSPLMFAALLYLLSIGMSLIFAYFFYLVFERPFTRTSASSNLKQEKAVNLRR